MSAKNVSIYSFLETNLIGRKKMQIKKATDVAFKEYGRVVTGKFDLEDLTRIMNLTEAPTDAVIYYPSIKELEELPVAEEIRKSFFGELPMQIGYCNGTNTKLNALEYHRNSEFGIAISDMIILVGKQQDIQDDFTYETSKVEAFYVNAGEMIEMYATTLHYAPCSVDGKPFRNVVILPKGTNTDLETQFSNMGEDALMTAKNKWLIAHEDAKIEGAVNGLKGINIEVK